MNNVVKLDIPEEVNTIQWAFTHPNCDALIQKRNGYNTTMTIVAYGLNEQGNDELLGMCNDDVDLFRGVDESLLSHLGGLV